MGNRPGLVFVFGLLLFAAGFFLYDAWRGAGVLNARMALSWTAPTFEAQLPPDSPYPECERRLRNSLRGWIVKGGLKPTAKGWRDGLTEAVMTYHDCEGRNVQIKP